MSKEIHALPEWFGWFVIILAIFIIYPAFSIMLESNSDEVYNTKISEMGIVFTTGTLVWAFLSWLVAFALIAVGINVVTKRDKSSHD